MLAQVIGTYRERPVCGPLQDHFVCAWIHQMPATAVPIVIVPDGAVDLEWVDGALRIAGPDRKPRTERFAAGTTVFGFRFRAAGAPSWLGSSPSEMVDGRILLEEFWGRSARHLVDALGEASDVASRMRLLERALTQRAPSVSQRHDDMAAVFKLMSAGAPPGRALVPWLAGELASSERTLRRRFHAAFGYGPKTLDRIMRFQRFLSLARGSPDASAATLAAAAGYADQAHLARESARLAAATPREIVRAFANGPASPER